ncbi:MAG: DUF4860 domain-containing protein [Atopobiaceae bacterium]|jgi:hypothetical protein|nr:DUF4860 domain-containing protein [Atopobiaceae bacterium]MCI2174080.1 DUF4860 domain-containing protein [Atopobiaceae bacterium]MCI2207830.1 DUF4860 domain-containing protein [Atopobiaceae bacterium]
MRTFTVVLMALFVIALLLSATVLVSVYSSVTSMSEETDAKRSLDLIANTIRSADERGAWSEGTGPEGPSIVLTRSTDGGSYETRIYLYQGEVMEEYALAGSDYSPAKADAVASSSTFDVSYDSGLVTVTTDQGSTSVALRSEGGGGQA